MTACDWLGDPGRMGTARPVTASDPLGEPNRTGGPRPATAPDRLGARRPGRPLRNSPPWHEATIGAGYDKKPAH
ncbi:hypothetical protein Acy02nite_54490 [Actinoplanes cyaneus]|uniref:Uncharacterized protein n=1 Tax=Actinoplanes cyaneus TaxID=52696 RepID=A0A919M7Q0_9ACTN|nr:hypothetical protein Acy02nite_54490 [Actinoplanes cyaneus]